MRGETEVEAQGVYAIENLVRIKTIPRPAFYFVGAPLPLPVNRAPAGCLALGGPLAYNTLALRGDAELGAPRAGA